MYISSNIANRIKEMAKFRNITIGKMLTECNLGINTVSQLQGEKDILSKNLAKIADYLNCSVDYLLGRTDIVEVNNTKKLLKEDWKKILYSVAKIHEDQEKYTSLLEKDFPTYEELKDFA